VVPAGILLHQAERSLRITTVSVRTELTVVIPMNTAGRMVIPDANHLIVSTLRICTVVPAGILLHQAEKSLLITRVSVRTELTVVIPMNTAGRMVIPDANHLIVSTLRIRIVVPADILLHQAERSLHNTEVWALTPVMLATFMIEDHMETVDEGRFLGILRILMCTM